jgi:hypothetical protein
MYSPLEQFCLQQLSADGNSEVKFAGKFTPSLLLDVLLMVLSQLPHITVLNMKKSLIREIVFDPRKSLGSVTHIDLTGCDIFPESYLALYSYLSQNSCRVVSLNYGCPQKAFSLGAMEWCFMMRLAITKQSMSLRRCVMRGRFLPERYLNTIVRTISESTSPCMIGIPYVQKQFQPALLAARERAYLRGHYASLNDNLFKNLVDAFLTIYETKTEPEEKERGVPD